MLPLRLFANKKEVAVCFGVLALVFALHVSLIYTQYRSFVGEGRTYVEGELLLSDARVSKNGKPYFALRVKTNAFLLYTVAWKETLHVRPGEQVSVVVITEKLRFLDFLSKRFFAPSFSLHALHVSEEGVAKRLAYSIWAQHESPKMQALYSALFLATPVPKALREDVLYWGVSHLVAISGFHLGVLLALGYGVVRPVYRFFQSRYFPYRNATFDVGVVMLGLAFGYLWLIGFVPSFLRAFVMAVFGFFLLMRHIKLLSFGTLALSVGGILALFPHLVLHIGFWFSVLGVFYIFLYLHHFKERFSAPVHAVLLNVWVFLAMNIPVHYWFPLTSWQQVGSIPLSLVFIGFYPLSGVLHVMGFGGVMDGVLEPFLAWRMEGADVPTPLWMLVGYLGLSLLGVRWRFLAVGAVLLGAVPFLLL
ncbi:MAG: ComEC/Rec2 family competence protein [Campylobacterales bacterium]|nr:ComEC/Rec2 family competence protein [Campylobacterales bacterium]